MQEVCRSKENQEQDEHTLVRMDDGFRRISMVVVHVQNDGLVVVMTELDEWGYPRRRWFHIFTDLRKLRPIPVANWLLAKFRRGVWHMMALSYWLDLQRDEMRRTHQLVREVSTRIEHNRVDIKAMKEAMFASIVKPNFMWIGEEAAQALGLPGSGAYERVRTRWIKRGEL